MSLSATPARTIARVPPTQARSSYRFGRSLSFLDNLVAGLADGSGLWAPPRSGRHAAVAASLRPASLRVTWWLDSGVPPTEVAAWAGHSVEVLMRTYAKCMTGLEDVWVGRMNQALHLEGHPKDQGQ